MRSTRIFLLALLLVLGQSALSPASAQESAVQAPAETPTDAPAEDPPETGTESDIEIAEAAVCVGVEDRAPVGAADSFDAGTALLYCFTDVRGAEGETIVHAWIHEGTTRARVELNVRGERWRTWSSKQILPEWTGQWEVKILTAEGVVLETLSFTVE